MSANARVKIRFVMVENLLYFDCCFTCGRRAALFDNSNSADDRERPHASVYRVDDSDYAQNGNTYPEHKPDDTEYTGERQRRAPRRRSRENGGKDCGYNAKDYGQTCRRNEQHRTLIGMVLCER